MAESDYCEHLPHVRAKFGEHVKDGTTYCRACGKPVANVPAGIRTPEASREADRREAVARFPITTANVMSDMPDAVVVGIVSAQAVQGMGVGRDFKAAFTDSLGGRSKTMEQAIATARHECLTELRRQAMDWGADAVVAVRFDYDYPGGMVAVAATGTAVRKPETDPPTVM